MLLCDCITQRGRREPTAQARMSESDSLRSSMSWFCTQRGASANVRSTQSSGSNTDLLVGSKYSDHARILDLEQLLQLTRNVGRHLACADETLGRRRERLGLLAVRLGERAVRDAPWPLGAVVGLSFLAGHTAQRAEQILPAARLAELLEGA
jgi:hypothetical protein